MPRALYSITCANNHNRFHCLRYATVTVAVAVAVANRQQIELYVLQDSAPAQVYHLHKPPSTTSAATTTAAAATAAATTAATASASTSRSAISRRSRYGDALRGYEEHKGNDSSSDENDSNSSDVDHSDNDESDTAANDNNLGDGEIIPATPTLPNNVLAVLADGSHLLKTPKCCIDEFAQLRKGPLFLFRIKLAPSEHKHGVGFVEAYGALGYLPSENGEETSEQMTEWNKDSRLMCFFGGRCVYMPAIIVYYRNIQYSVV
jgi:hypothetical protein